jgi:hypothetical protein
MRVPTGLAALAALVFCAASAAAEPLPSWPDPFDPATVRTQDWATIEASPFWAAAKDSESGLRTEEDETYRNVKVVNMERSGSPLEGDLRVARDGSGRHVVRVWTMETSATECPTIRARLRGLYGPPAAERVETLTLQDSGQHDDEAQWRGIGTTSITLDCSTLRLGNAVFYNYWMELEPAVDAPPLAPIFGLRCDGLFVHRPSVLEIDIYRQTVSLEHGVIGRGKISEAAIDVKLRNGRRLHIDRATGAYTLASDAGADISHGVCSKVDLPS